MPIVFSRVKIEIPASNHYSSSQAARKLSASPFITALCLAVHHRRRFSSHCQVPHYCRRPCWLNLWCPAAAAVSRERDLSFSP
ncbi:hypothetical protein VIGAN_01146700, partial [Vigna angularis var. angularis]